MATSGTCAQAHTKARKYGKIPNPPKSAKTSILGSYMAVWPDPTHGKCSYGHFNILIFGKSDMFENH